MKPEINLEKIAQKAEEREDENWRFRSYLKWQDSEEIDEMVHEINDRVTAAIDCIQCANCCKTLQTQMYPEDISRLVKIKSMSEEEIFSHYLEEDNGDVFLKDVPCTFLEGNKCSIYADRPCDCRDYPHLHKDGFTFRLFGVINNYRYCPIVYNVVEELKARTGFRR